MMALLIEDEPEMAELATKYITKPHPIVGEITCVRAARLKQGLEQACSIRFDVIVLDLSLTDSTSNQTRESIPALSSRAPVVVLTGDDDPVTVKNCIDSGAVDFVFKGEDLKQLQHAVVRAGMAKHLNRYEEERQNRLVARMIKSELNDISTEMKQLRHD